MNSKKSPRASVPPLERPKICLILDSNLLYTTDSEKLASREFEMVVNDYRKAAEIDVYLPRVVIEERIQQTVERAMENLESLCRSARRLNVIANLDISPALPGSQAIRTQIEKRYEVWKENLGIKVLETPMQLLDLNEIIERAVRKVGVFEGQRKVITADKVEYLEVKEKGFKDYVIQRTIEHSLTNIGLEKYHKVVVGTDDERLRTELKAVENKNIEVLGKWSEILENIATLLSNLTEEQIGRVRPICEAAFRKELLPLVSNELRQFEVAKHSQETLRNSFADTINSASAIGLRNNFLLQLPPIISVQEIETIFIGKDNGAFRWKTTLEVSNSSGERSYFPSFNINDRFECEWVAELTDNLVVTSVQSIKEPVKLDRPALGLNSLVSV